MSITRQRALDNAARAVRKAEKLAAGCDYESAKTWLQVASTWECIADSCCLPS